MKEVKQTNYILKFITTCGFFLSNKICYLKSNEQNIRVLVLPYRKSSVSVPRRTLSLPGISTIHVIQYFSIKLDNFKGFE